MPANPLDHEIRSRIDAFLEDLAGLVRRRAVESVRQALDGTAPSAAARAPAAAPARRRGRLGRKLGRPAGAGADGNGRPAKATAAAKPAKPSPKRGRQQKRRSSDAVAELGKQVQAFVASNPGTGIEAIAKGLKKPSKQLKPSVRHLVKDGTLRIEGVKRGARYFAN